jgi:carbonic anhydrase
MTLRAEPAKGIAIVTCMDCRIDALGALGLELGDAHVLRNAGGVVTDDMIRSLAISQRRLGTTQVALVHHTRCGMEGLDEHAFREELRQAAGSEPPFAIGSFADAEADVRESVRRLHDSPLLPHRDRVRGFIYDVDTGGVREVD